MIVNRRIFSSVWFLCLLFSGTAPAFDEIDIQELPRDEKEAQDLLGDGVLDSALWRKVEPFYTTPLCVPRGELRILQDLFFSLPDGLPSTAAALSKYLPWDDAAQERLFTEYPELLPFKPILSFEDNGAGVATGKMAFCFSRPGGSDTVRQYAVFSAGRERAALQAEGRVDFTNEYGRWFRRTVTLVPHPGYRLTLGNFGNDFRERLFYGYFPAMSASDGASDTSLAGNWLYGTSRSWNGVLFSAGNGTDWSCGTMPITGKAFVHDGPGERMAYGESTVGIAKQVSFWSGVSHLQSVDSSKRWSENSYFHCGFAVIPAGNCRCELQSGVDLRRPALVPFDVTWSQHDDNSRLRASLTGLPNGFYAPRSALCHYVTSKTGMDDTVDGYATAVDVQFTHLQNTSLTWTPRISAIFAGDALRYLSTEIGASGCIAFVKTYRAQYRWSPLFQACGQTIFRRQGLLECSVPLGRTVCFVVANRYNDVSDGYRRYSVTITPQLAFGRVIRLAPLLVLAASSTRSLEKTIGVQQTARFSEKTCTEIKIEKQFPESNGGTVSAQGRMSFLF